MIFDYTTILLQKGYDSTAKRSLSNKPVGAEYLPPAYMEVYNIRKNPIL